MEDSRGGDDPARYLSMPAVVATAVNDQQVDKNVRVGLVGMHIAHKSKSSPQWIWSTFEQVDNLDVDPVAHPKLKPPSSTPAARPACRTRSLPKKMATGYEPKTQAVRAIPIPNDKRTSTSKPSRYSRKSFTVAILQLIDTQWPTDPALRRRHGPPVCGCDHQQAGRQSDSSLSDQHHMETYFQTGVQPACQQEEVPNSVQCPPVRTLHRHAGCRRHTRLWHRELHGLPFLGRYPHLENRPKIIRPADRDFSWLFSQKAK